MGNGDVRLIAATNPDPSAELLSRRFREDLFYRLSSIHIRIPSLAERLEDIPLLVQFFLKKYYPAYGKDIADLTIAFAHRSPWTKGTVLLES